MHGNEYLLCDITFFYINSREGGLPISLRRDGMETKKKILTVCVRLFLEQGYRQTTITQFGVARSIADCNLPPVYTYAVETAIQLTLTELKQLFGDNFPDYAESDFYEMEIGTAGLIRNYMARRCDIHFPLDHKLRCFLTSAMRL